MNKLGSRLRHGHAKSSGCSPEYRSWKEMRSRCTKPAARAYSSYGAKGITFCERWQLFENFFADMGPRPFNTTLDRIDSKGNYEPGNCRWADPFTQARNRSNNCLLTAFGETKPIAAWAEDPRCVVKAQTLRDRVNLWGFNPEISMTTPPRKLRKVCAK